MEMHQLPIPEDIWKSMVLPKLSLKDYIRCSAVCRCWRKIAAENQRSLHSLPWVMLSQDKDTHTALFYSLREGITYILNLTDSASNSFCTGSTQGCLILSDGEANFVFNPFSQRTTPLPPQFVPPANSKLSLRKNRHYYNKSILSASDPSCLLVASLCTDTLVTVTCSSNNKEWSVFGIERCPSLLISRPELPPGLLHMPPPPQDDEEEEEEEEEDDDEDDDDDEQEEEDDDNDEETRTAYEEDTERWHLMDMIFYKGMLYGLSELFTLVRFNNLEDANAKPKQVMNMVTTGMPERGWSMSQGYLVESSCGDLLMVYRIRDKVDPVEFRYVTEKFLVFKLDDKSGNELKWVEVKSLGDEMIYLGRNSSISFSAKGIPGLKGNCIYFTDEAFPIWSWDISHVPVVFTDNGVYHLEEGRIDSFLPPGLSTSLKSQPIWVMPNKLEGYSYGDHMGCISKTKEQRASSTCRAASHLYN